MFVSYVIGLVVIIALMVTWVGVQSAWRKAFPAVASDPDVLAGRMGCHGCDDIDVCSHRPATRAVSAKEEIL